MQQNQQGQQRPGNYVGNQMAMRAQGQQQSGYPMGGQPRVPNPGQPSPNFMAGNNQPGPQAGYRPQMGGKKFKSLLKPSFHKYFFCEQISFPKKFC